MDQAEAEALAKKYGSELEAADDESGMFGETDSDRPAYKTWSDSIRKRVKICYIWKLEKGVWRHSIFTKSGLIWEGDSPYLDEDEKPCNPIESQSPMVDRENARYGYARLMISQQDAINKRESSHCIYYHSVKHGLSRAFSRMLPPLNKSLLSLMVI